MYRVNPVRHCHTGSYSFCNWHM